ncbi:LamG-like jellyroll fold domain-containing protein [Flexivirga lutea]
MSITQIAGPLAAARLSARRSARRSGRRSGWAALLLTAVSRAVLTMLAGLLLWSVVPSLLGWHSTVVMSDSMAPRLRVGDIAISRPVAAGQQLRLGQVLLVSDPDHPDRLRLHRLAAIRPDGRLTLKGDANRADDSSPVARSAVHGIGSLRVPFVGTPAYWVSTGHQARLVLLVLAFGGLLAGAVAFRPDEIPEDDDADDAHGGAHGDADDDPVGHADGRADGSSGADGRGEPAGTPEQPGPSRRRRAVAAFAVTTITATGVGVAGPADAATTFSATTTESAGWAAATYFSCTGVVLGDQANPPFLYYELTDSSTRSGKAAADSSGNARTGTYQGTVTAGAAGPCSPGGKGATLNGSSGWISTPTKVAGPNTFTLQTWFKTTSTSGGELIGFGDSQTGQPSNYDRHLYLTDSGQVVFGVYPGSVQTINSPGTYRDNAWHQVTATLSSAGMQLYVDGVRVAANAAVTTAQNYDGWWHIGWNNLTNWGSTTPTGRYFAGSMAGVAVYPTALSSNVIAAGYALRNGPQ